MRNIMAKAWQFFAKAERGINIIAAGIVFAMMFFTSAEIIGRRFFQSPVPGHYEISEQLLVAIAFLALSYTQMRLGHVRVEMVVNRLPRKLGGAAGLVGLILSALYGSVIGFLAGKRGLLAYQTQDYTPGLIQLPTWPAFIFIAIGSLFFCIRVLTQVLDGTKRLHSANDGSPAPADAPGHSM